MITLSPDKSVSSAHLNILHHICRGPLVTQDNRFTGSRDEDVGFLWGGGIILPTYRAVRPWKQLETCLTKTDSYCRDVTNSHVIYKEKYVKPAF